MQMRSNDRFGFRADRRLDEQNFEVRVVGADVDQHRPGAEGLDRPKVAWKIVSGQNHFLAGRDADAPQGQFHGEGAGAAKCNETCLKEGGQRLGQLPAVLAVVTPPAPIGESPLKGLQHLSVGRRPDGRSRAGSRSALDGQRWKHFRFQIFQI